MKAPAAARALPKLAERARQEEWSYERFAEALLSTEISSRESSGGRLRIRAARFPAHKTLEEFDFTFQRSVKKQVIEHLGQLDFLHAKHERDPARPARDRQDAHLRSRSGIRACLAGQRVLFRTATEWVALLADAQRQGRLDDELARLERIPLLVCDEVGYIPFDPQAASLMFMLVSRRYERASMIVTSNKPFSAWGEIFGDDMAATAMVDRLIHHAEILSLKGDSYRLKDRDLGPRPAAKASKPPDRYPSATSPRAAERLTTRRSAAETSIARLSPGGSCRLRRSAGRRSAFASPRRRDPARDQKRTLLLAQDQVSNLRQTARVPHAPWLPINVAVEHRGVKLAVLVHEHELLAELVLEIPHIAPPPFFDRRRRRRVMIADAQELILVHTTTITGGDGGATTPSRDAEAPIAAHASPLGARPSRRRALWHEPRGRGVSSQPALRGQFSTGLDNSRNRGKGGQPGVADHDAGPSRRGDAHLAICEIPAVSDGETCLRPRAGT